MASALSALLAPLGTLDAHVAVGVAVVLIYVPHVAKIVAMMTLPRAAKDGEKLRTSYDVRSPRVLVERAIAGASGYSRADAAFIARAEGAHQNGFETFAIFAACVALAEAAGAPRAATDASATAFVVLRVLYIAVYLANTRVALASVRSLIFLAQLVVCGVILASAYAARGGSKSA